MSDSKLGEKQLVLNEYLGIDATHTLLIDIFYAVEYHNVMWFYVLSVVHQQNKY